MKSPEAQSPSVRLVTPSYAPDFALFESLHDSVLQFTDSSVTHEVIVPRKDVPLFGSLRSPRLQVSEVREFLPSGFVSVSMTTARVARLTRVPSVSKIQEFDIVRPWMPVRGWILQQVVKLAATARAVEDVVITLDSDVELIGEVLATDLIRGEAVRLFEDPRGVTGSMPNHLAWHDTARALLGLPPPGNPPLADYISGMVSWNPRTVRALLDRVEQVGGKSWVRCITARLKFSEDILYGAYVSGFGTESERHFVSTDPRCVSHWEPTAMTDDDVLTFLSAVKPTDVAVQVQSTSSTSREVRRDLIDGAAAKVQR